MAVQSGTSGNVTILDNDADTSATKVHEVTSWSIDRPATDSAYASNMTAGYRYHIVGTKDVTGTISGVFDPATPISSQIEVGDRVLLQLHFTDLIGHQFYAAIVSGPNLSVDIENGELTRWTCNYALADTTPLFDTTTIDANP